MIKNIIVFAHEFKWDCGGKVVQYYLCSLLDNLGLNVRIAAYDENAYISQNRLLVNNIENPIFSKFYNNDLDMNETLVIYGECIGAKYSLYNTFKGTNPLRGIHVMRWILCRLGVHCDDKLYRQWNKKDLVYYYNNEPGLEQLNKGIVKFLNPVFINPIFKKIKHETRTKSFYTERKMKKMHKNITYIHPPESINIPYGGFSHNDLLILFNDAYIFYSYDPLTLLTIIASMCGCISVVYKVEGLTKYEWLMTTYM